MIDWMAFLTVFGAALGSSVFVVGLYSLGIRFLATPAVSGPLADGSVATNGPARDDEEDDIETEARPGWATFMARFCFALSAIAALAGVIVIVPALHPW